MNIQLNEFLTTHSLQPQRLLLALSGGLDSMVLLHLLEQQRANLPVVHAIHVHHQLQTVADTWAEFCQQQCEQRGIHYSLLKVEVDMDAGEGIEAAARKARYAALAEQMRAGDILLTAHHADDQAETLLLQLFRGAGIDGTAAMPLLKPFAGGQHARPLLQITRDELQAFAHQYQLQWVEDPSNLDIRFDRNFLRQTILPRLAKRWPALVTNLGRVAQNHAETQVVMNYYLEGDLAGLVKEGRLHWPSLVEVERSRQGLLLRHWIMRSGHRPPSRKVLARMLDELFTSRQDANPQVAWGNSVVRRYREHLHVMHLSPAFDTNSVYDWDTRQGLDVTAAGRLVMIEAETGFPRDWAGKEWQVRFRHGGEVVQGADGHHLQVKKLMQVAAIPPWQRERLPLIYCQGKLVYIPGVYMAPECSGPGILPSWSPDSSISD